MKRDMKKVMALMLAGSLMVVPATASAEKGGNSGKDSKSLVENRAELKSISGVIQSVNDDEITVNTTELGLGRFLADDDVNIQDQDGETITIEDLKAGMVLEIEGDFSVAGMSIPAYYGGTTDITVKSEKIIQKAVEDVSYNWTEGEVTEIADNKITVKQNGTLKVFNLATIIIGTKDGEIISKSKIEAGDYVTALYKSNTPMTTSEPAQLTPMMIILDNGNSRLKIDSFDSNLISSDGKLRLVVDDDTIIEEFETNDALTAADLKNRDLVAIYGATTRSIPAQTLTDGIVKIIVLPILEKDVTNTSTNSSNGTTGNSGTAHQKVAIAKIARSMGYKVNWNPKTKVVLLSKAGDAIEIFVGTTRYKMNGMEKKASLSNNLNNGSTYVSSEILDLLKK